MEDRVSAGLWLGFLILWASCSVSIGAEEDAAKGRVAEGLELATEVNGQGVLAAQKRQLDEAQEHWQRALEIRQEFAPGSHELAQTLNNLGVLAAIRGDLDGAAKNYMEALRIWRSLEPSSLDLAGVLSNLGVVSVARGELEQAMAYYDEALEIRRRLAPDGLKVAESLDHLGVVAYHRGDLEKASSLFEEALRIKQEKAPDRLDRNSLINRLGSLASAHSEWDWAGTYFRSGLEVQRQLTPESLGLTAGTKRLRKWDSFRGDLDRASEYHAWGLKLQQKFTSMTLGAAQALFTEGVIARNRGDLGTAIEYHTEALRIRRKLAPKSLLVADSLNKLGYLFHLRGDLVRAASYLQDALSIKRDLVPGSLSLVRTLNFLGSVLQSQGNYERADQFLGESLEITASIAPGSLNMAAILERLGFLAFKRGDFPLAKDYLEKCLGIRESLEPVGMGITRVLYFLGDLASASGDLGAAVEFYERNLEVYRKLYPHGYEDVRVLSGLANIRYQQGRKQEAFSLSLQAITALERELSDFGGTHDIQSRGRANFSYLYSYTIDRALELQLREEAFRILEQFRAQSFLAQFAEREVRLSKLSEDLEVRRREIASDYDQLQAEFARVMNGEDRKKVAIQLQRLRWQRDDLEEQIFREGSLQEAVRYPQALSFAAAQKALSPGTLLLSYRVDKSKTTLFYAGHEGGLGVLQIDIDEPTLRNKVRAWGALIPQALAGDSTGAIQEVNHLGEELYNTLVEPVSDILAGSERLLIIPDGPLHLLPWAALRRPLGPGSSHKQYLVEWKPIHTALSVTVHAQLRKSLGSVDPSPAPPIRFIAFGDPLFPESEEMLDDSRLRDAVARGLSKGLSPLPHTAHEVEQIATFFPPAATRIYFQADATEEAFKLVGRHARFLHLATHGHLDNHNPLDSGIVLSIPSRVGASGRDNGLLQAWEIFEEVRLNADLVVLSACSSGIGEERPGEGLIGLTRAFHYAGARSVLASLWDVRDQATAQLMVRFYRQLNKGLPKAEALRMAQMELIRGEVNDLGHPTRTWDLSAPYYWAAFQLYGDWR